MDTANIQEKGADFLRYLHSSPVGDIGKDSEQTLAAVTVSDCRARPLLAKPNQ